MRYALTDPDGLVVNVVLLAEPNDWTPDDTLTLHPLDEGVRVGPGWTYDGNTWVEPVAPEPQPSVDALLQRQINELTDLILFGF